MRNWNSRNDDVLMICSRRGLVRIPKFPRFNFVKFSNLAFETHLFAITNRSFLFNEVTAALALNGCHENHIPVPQAMTPSPSGGPFQARTSEIFDCGKGVSCTV